MKKTPSDYAAETVLVVDDDDIFRSHLADYLRHDGFQIVETNSSSDACRLIREGKVSIVLLDWDLHKHISSPDDSSTGLKVVRACREVDALMPVVVMSGAILYDARDDALTAGADSFLNKAFAMSLISEHLRRWICRLRAERNPFTQLAAGVIETADTVNRAYARAVVERVGSVLQAAPKLGLSRQTVASYLASPSLS